MSVTIRLAARDVDPLEVVFFRNVFNLLFIQPWFIKIGFAGLRTDRFGLHCFSDGFWPDFHVLMVYRADFVAAG